jgi:serine/threonine protein kinase
MTAEKQENVLLHRDGVRARRDAEAIIARDGALDVALALDYTCQICNAVDHAHRHGVPPRSTAVERARRRPRMLKVADFGMSRFLEIAAHGMTVIGSPPPLAPEVSGQGGVRLGPLFAGRHHTRCSRAICRRVAVARPMSNG